jgi:hypothetical protein
MSESSVGLSSGPPETELPEAPAESHAALESARRLPVEERPAATRVVAGSYPRLLEAWADLAELAAAAGDHVGAYAFARVGYHRGLDALRGAGWRGSGYVRSAHEPNRGFLRSLAALAAAAGAIGEEDEAERCRLFLRQLDPHPGGGSAASG